MLFRSNSSFSGVGDISPSGTRQITRVSGGSRPCFRKWVMPASEAMEPSHAPRAEHYRSTSPEAGGVGAGIASFVTSPSSAGGG